MASDRHGKHNKPTIAFRVTPYEQQVINERVKASGMKKQDYIVRSCIYNHVCVVGKRENLEILRSEAREMYTVLEEVSKDIKKDSPALSEQGMESMTERFLAFTAGGVQTMTFIPEGDVYRLITKSHLPSAQRFESWVFDEILPAIRKTGGYMSSDLLESVRNNPEILLEFAQRLLDENNRNRELQSQINDLQPKANYFDHFMVKGECSNIRTTAKEIGVPERKFVKFLLKGSFLYRSPSGTLLPYAVPKNESLFIVRDFFNNGHLGSQTLITPKGECMKILTKFRMYESKR